MKKIFILVVVVTIITIFLVSEPKEIKYGYVSNITIKLKDKERIINLPLEEYVLGVVAGEVPATFDIEALKVQAIIARTYVLKRYSKDNYYDVENSISNQVYLSNAQMQAKWDQNYEKYYKKIYSAVKDTRGLVILYDNKLIDALYFSISSGKTENSEDVFKNNIPYLRSVDSSWDSSITKQKDTKKITMKEIKEVFNIEENNIKFDILKRTTIGSCQLIKINNVEYNCTDFRIRLGLKSTNFTIEKNNDFFVFNTIGYGHGVGLSQYGSNVLAKQGYNYSKIIKHYYTDVKIKKIN